MNIIFILLPGSCTGVGLGVLEGVKIFSVGICDRAPSTARSSIDFSIDFEKNLYILQWNSKFKGS